MSLTNPLWGAPRIHGELLKLGIDVGQTSVAKYMARHRRPPSQGWKTFLRNHADGIVRDRDRVYGEIFTRRLRAMGIRDRPTAPRSPWQNGHTERLIGSLRRECLDHVVVFGERHPRHMLLLYMAYYNGARTHLSLNKDAPVPRAVQAAGRIHATPILGGLHHHYVRI
jgi:transposase InsO family protein